jgi:hypothetical protein
VMPTPAIPLRVYEYFSLVDGVGDDALEESVELATDTAK